MHIDIRFSLWNSGPRQQWSANSESGGTMPLGQPYSKRKSFWQKFFKSEKSKLLFDKLATHDTHVHEVIVVRCSLLFIAQSFLVMGNVGDFLALVAKTLAWACHIANRYCFHCFEQIKISCYYRAVIRSWRPFCLTNYYWGNCENSRVGPVE